MGTNISVQDNESLTSIVNKSVTKTASEFKNSSTTSSSSDQTISVKIIKSITGNINASMKTSIGVTAILQADTNVMTKLTNDLTANVNKRLNNNLTQLNKELNFGQTNVASVKNKTVNNTVNDVTNSVTLGVQNSVEMDVSGKQITAFIIDQSKIGNMTINMESIITALSSNIAKAIADTSVKNTLDSKEITDLTNTVSQTNDGLDVMAFMTIIGLAIAGVVGLLGVKSLKSVDHAVDACASNPQLCENLVDKGIAASGRGGPMMGRSKPKTQYPPQQQYPPQGILMTQPQYPPMNQPQYPPMNQQPSIAGQYPITQKVIEQNPSRENDNTANPNTTLYNIPGMGQPLPTQVQNSREPYTPIPTVLEERDIRVFDKANMNYGLVPIPSDNNPPNGLPRPQVLYEGKNPYAVNGGLPSFDDLNAEEKKKVVTAVIIIFVILLILQYQTHVMWAKLHKNEIYSSVSKNNDKPPMTVFKFIPKEYLPLYEIPVISSIVRIFS